jgi:hypothetical protein
VAEPESISDDLKILDAKLNQLKREYEQYFLGTRPREPVLLAGEVRKLIGIRTNNPFPNTALKFKFSSICSRYQAFNRQWQENLRKIEQGTYIRHRFKADLHERARQASAQPESVGNEPSAAEPDLFSEYRDARLACGQGIQSLSPEKFELLLEKQRAALRERYGDAEFRFRVAVEQGKAKLKASRERG